MGVTKSKLGETPVVILPELNFHTKTYKYSRSANSNDVYVSITGYKSKYHSLNFTFRNKMYEVFNGEYLIFAQLKNRIYFKVADKKEGYHLTVRGLSAVCKINLHTEEVAELEKFTSNEYALKYDDFYELYYIQLDTENDETT